MFHSGCNWYNSWLRLPPSVHLKSCHVFDFTWQGTDFSHLIFREHLLIFTTCHSNAAQLTYNIYLLNYSLLKCAKILIRAKTTVILGPWRQHGHCYGLNWLCDYSCTKTEHKATIWSSAVLWSLTPPVISYSFWHDRVNFHKNSILYTDPL